ncbi:hypothetical protein FACS1894172_10370 [Spirochaetia bacterium]|nr:hypothetical protein FACS1894172_10370 [Spirochaetia bacterium]
MNSNFSGKAQLETIANILTGYIKVPFALETIPGSFMENVLAHVRKGIALNTYDFVDVINSVERIGWQVKSTKDTTPVTWKRAKIKDANNLIRASQQSAQGLIDLGSAIIDFCNEHALESIEKYHLTDIYYSRLVVCENREVLYFERLLCTQDSPDIFDKDEFYWKWSSPKNTVRKEQLPALHGYNKNTNEKWFAWHGLGENQLHFSGERNWWPNETDQHHIRFLFPKPDERLSQDQFMALLQSVSM